VLKLVQPLRTVALADPETSEKLRSKLMAEDKIVKYLFSMTQSSAVDDPASSADSNIATQ
jgi:hypothetical protein